jgi:hypothetical protein
LKYLCLVYHDEEKLNAMSPAELDTLMADCVTWLDDLQKSGRYVLSAALQALSTATTVRSRGGKLAITDGPFAETKEIVGGFTLIEARDLNEAIQIASTLPVARFGSVEVRPVLESGMELSDPLDRKLVAALRHTASEITRPPQTTTR